MQGCIYFRGLFLDCSATVGMRGTKLAIREILQIPHPVLRQRARKVRALNDDVLRLAYDMVDTMRDANGVGLAANQVGELWRVIVIQLPEEEEARIYVNPEITIREASGASRKAA